MTAIEAMKKELNVVLSNQADCFDENGVIFSSRRYEYQELTRQATEFKNCINYLENLKRGTK